MTASTQPPPGSAPKRLRGRIAFVTGASSGIGRATATALADEGAAVALVGRREATLHAVADAVRARGAEARTHVADVRDAAAVAAAAASTREHWGPIDVLVTAAGSGGSLATERGVPFALVQLPSAEWREIVDTNVKGSWHAIHAVLPGMRERRSGVVVLVSSSRGATRGLPFAAAYSASKHALMGLAEALTAELRGSGVRIQTVLPDVADTPMMKATGNLAPDGLLAPATVARWIVDLVCLPPEVAMPAPVLLPVAPRGAPS